MNILERINPLWALQTDVISWTISTHEPYSGFEPYLPLDHMCINFNCNKHVFGKKSINIIVMSPEHCLRVGFMGGKPSMGFMWATHMIAVVIVGKSPKVFNIQLMAVWLCFDQKKIELDISFCFPLGPLAPFLYLKKKAVK